MGRAWRIEYEGAVYHVLSRGTEQKEIFRDDQDRLRFLETIGEMAERYAADIFAYVLMGNHYHLLLRTNRAKLSKAREIPQQRDVAKGVDPVALLSKAAQIIDCDLGNCKESKRITKSAKDDRDLLVFFIWKTGLLTNETIGQLFGVTYSSISHIVNSMKSRLKKGSPVKRKI